MAEPTRVAIACDHAGVALKRVLAASLRAAGHPLADLGTDGAESVDYPDFAAALAAEIESGRADRGVLICGSGIGISIAANRHAAVRCALVHDVTGARLARQHNDANVIALGARLVGEAVALDCLKTFLETDFEGGRHARRVAKLSAKVTA
ncbi:MAG: ribose 5-phosphate isomerase B [Acetobacteraceae bacterium]|nr:ribose 5-phosphate isomerase B [Acetobacteraceae bacterium]